MENKPISHLDKKINVKTEILHHMKCATDFLEIQNSVKNKKI